MDAPIPTMRRDLDATAQVGAELTVNTLTAFLNCVQCRYGLEKFSTVAGGGVNGLSVFDYRGGDTFALRVTDAGTVETAIL